jgi:hypothetical protein
MSVFENQLKTNIKAKHITPYGGNSLCTNIDILWKELRL